MAKKEHKKNKETELEEKEEVEVINPLEEEIEKLQAEVAKLKNEYARAYADTENMRKRLQNEADQARKYRIQGFALEILPVIDNLERALGQKLESEEANNFRTGLKMIYDQLVNALKNEGVEEVEVLDKPYDPNFAQAIATEKVDGKESGLVLEVFQKGYKLKDRILRAAMVKISE